MPNWNRLLENTEWLSVHQHLRRTEWRAMVIERNDVDHVLPKKLKILKILDLIGI